MRRFLVEIFNSCPHLPIRDLGELAILFGRLPFQTSSASRLRVSVMDAPLPRPHVSKQSKRRAKEVAAEEADEDAHNEAMQFAAAKPAAKKTPRSDPDALTRYA